MSDHEDVRAGDDTIVAIITPPGEGGIAAVRIAGPESREILQRCVTPEPGKSRDIIPFTMRLGHFVDPEGETIDEVTAVFMPAGRSYTGLDQAEIFCHGGRQVVQMILDNIVKYGARPAEPGEFTKLAFLNGRIDLARAEAVAEIIAAGTETSYLASREHLLGKYSEHIGDIRQELVELLAQVEASIDFVEEDIDPDDNPRLAEKSESLISRLETLVETYSGGRIIREGFKIAIAGRPNAGKSSLFNLLLKEERALVNPTPGTTRDYLSEWIDLDGFAVNLIDTAGLRQEGDEVEKAGQNRSEKIISQADLVIWMADVSITTWHTILKGDIAKLSDYPIMLIGNKIDISELGLSDPGISRAGALPLSCMTGEGFDQLRDELSTMIRNNMPDLTDGLVVTSARHQKKLTEAISALKSARQKLADSESPELTAFDLAEARKALDEITGKVYTEDLLAEIFSTFCIGK